MRLRLQELQNKDDQAWKVRTEQPGKADWQDVKSVLHHQGLLYIPEIIRMELISRHHNDPLASHFGIEKIRELVAQKYYSPMLCRNVEDYVKGCNVCLASKAVHHKLYGNLQSLPVLTYHWKDLLMNFVTSLPILIYWKRDSYNSILVIVDWLIKMIYYKLIKVTIDASSLAEVIINVIMRHHNLSDSIVTDQGSLFTLKF